MESNHCYLKNGKGRQEALAELEKAAAYCELPKQEGLYLRLLGEELTGMMAGLVGRYEGEFWVQADGRQVELHLLVDKKLTLDERERLVDVSTRGKNEAARGIMGKICTMFEAFADSYEETGQYCVRNGIYMTGMNDIYHSCIVAEDCVSWSLRQYASQIGEEEKGEAWDELEKSIIARLADEILVSIRNRQAEIIVKKTFRS